MPFDPIIGCALNREIVQLRYPHIEECIICLQPMHMKKVRYMPCKHVFHSTCVVRWLKRKRTCPCCRREVRKARRRIREADVDNLWWLSGLDDPILLDLLLNDVEGREIGQIESALQLIMEWRIQTDNDSQDE